MAASLLNRLRSLYVQTTEFACTDYGMRLTPVTWGRPLGRVAGAARALKRQSAEAAEPPTRPRGPQGLLYVPYLHA